MLPSLVLVISPLPGLTLTPHFPNVLDIPPRMAPFSPDRILTALSSFLSPIPEGKRVLMAFDDPEGDYASLFDNYRTLVAPIQYVATRNQISLIPDWIAVVELNYEGSPNIWGRDVPMVLENMRRWKSDYAIAYTVNDEPLSGKWKEAGLHVVSTFDWKKYQAERRGQKCMDEGPPPKWWLLAPSGPLNGCELAEHGTR